MVVELALARPRPALPRAQPRAPRLRTPRRPSDTEAAPRPVPTPQPATGHWVPPLESWRAQGKGGRTSHARGVVSATATSSGGVSASSVSSVDGDYEERSQSEEGGGGRGKAEEMGRSEEEERRGEAGDGEGRGTAPLWSHGTPASDIVTPPSRVAATAPRDAAPRDSALGYLSPREATPYSAPRDTAPRDSAPRDLALRDLAPRDAASGRLAARQPWEDPPRCGSSSHLILPWEEEQEQEEEETRALRQVFAAGISGLELSSLGPEAEAARDELCAALWRGFEVSK